MGFINLPRLTFTHIAIVIGFQNLTAIDITNCTVNNLEGISTLGGLKSLVMQHNYVTELNQEFAKLSSTLECLELTSNPLKELPDFITTFSKLKELGIGDTMLTKLPEDFGKLSNLRHLAADNTMIHKLPRSFKDLKVMFLYKFLFRDCDS